MRVRAGLGWPEGFVGSTFECARSRTRRPRALRARARRHRGPPQRPALARAAAARARRRLQRHGADRRARGPAGLLGAHTRTQRTFSAQDLDFLTAVAHVLNGAVEGLRTEERIRHDALHDALTGLPNRALLLERLSDAIARADAEGRSLALFFLDVDHLKVLNDSLGHHAGDELLRAIGPRLRAVLRPEDMIARFGGDEFAVLCEGVGDEAHALRVAERLVRAFAQPVRGPRRAALLLDQRRRRRQRPGRPARPGRAALGRRRGALPRQGARPRPPRGLRHRPARPHDRAAADRGRPAPRARRPATSCGSPTSPTTRSRTGGSRASRRCCAGTTPSAARSRRPSSSRSPRTRA